jgi:hypothetical protein
MAPTVTPPPALAAALEYAGRGWPVFPVHSLRDGKCTCGKADCARPGKHPRTPKGRDDASTDPRVIAAHWSRWPDANVGIATGALPGGGFLVVLDVDPRHGGDETLGALEGQHGRLPETARVLTGGGGMHVYFASSADVQSSVARVGEGLDIRARGGYVLAPPSNHESGRLYQEDAGAPFETELAEVPEWLRVLASKPDRKASASPVEGAVIEGGRNQALTSLAGSMRRRGFGTSSIFAALTIENRERCRPPLDDLEVRRIAAGMSRYESQDPATGASPWGILGVSDLATELPPIPWICEGIGLAPGAVSLVAGYGYSRKTMAMQSLGLSVAAGRPVWGVYGTRKGPFVHLDYEQGRRLTQERYQRLARGMGFELGELDPGSLRVACMPRLYLDAKEAFDELLELCDGAAFALVDSMRAAFPHADENSSEVRSYLDVLSRVSERTGCAFAVIHHARKPNAQNGGTATHAIRGSSALFDACQSVYVFEGEKDTPTTVHHQKDRVRGVTLEPFGLTSVDLAGPSGGRWGLAVRHLEGEQMTQQAEHKSSERIEATLDRMAERIVKFFAEHNGEVQGSKRKVLDLIGGNARAFRTSWARLEECGVLVGEGTERKPSWRMVR